MLYLKKVKLVFKHIIVDWQKLLVFQSLCSLVTETIKLTKHASSTLVIYVCAWTALHTTACFVRTHDHTNSRTHELTNSRTHTVQIRRLKHTPNFYKATTAFKTVMPGSFAAMFASSVLMERIDHPNGSLCSLSHKFYFKMLCRAICALFLDKMERNFILRFALLRSIPIRQFSFKRNI